MSKMVNRVGGIYLDQVQLGLEEGHGQGHPHQGHQIRKFH